MNTIQATRYHDFSSGHRVCGHESVCSHLHGHNYRATFTIEAPALDNIGRVLDFSVIKNLMCEWLEDNWDHKFLVWEEDPWALSLKETDPDGVKIIKFNPTAENMAEYLIDVVGPQQLANTNAVLSKVELSETRKCSVVVTKS